MEPLRPPLTTLFIKTILKSCIMEKNMNLFLLSFGDSEKYRLPFAGSLEELKESPLMATVRKELADYIKSKIGMGSDASAYADPRIQEVAPDEAAGYERYPLFDSSSLGRIKDILLNEVKDMDSVRELNLNAPFGLS